MVRVFPAIALVAAQLLAMTASEFVEFNYDIAKSYAGNGVSFLPTDRNPLPGHLLMGLEASDKEPPSVIPCSTTSEKAVSGTATVLIAISKCLSDESVNVITAWAKEIATSQKTFFDNDMAKHVKFSVVTIPGTCQALSEANAHGQVSLMADEDRLAGFRDFARVLDAMPPGTLTETRNATNENPETKTTTDTKTPVAVISFVDTDKSFNTVEQYERTAKIDKTFNFQICENGRNCNDNFENCITLTDAVEVFMYNPFTIATSLNCQNLNGGNPIMYLDGKNTRQCACVCPTGTKLSDNKKKCETVSERTCKCVWATANGYKHTITDALETCTFTRINDLWGIPAPVPLDNYVDKRRVNANDGDTDPLKLKNGPHIDLLSSRIEDPVYNIDKAKSPLTEAEIKKQPRSNAGPTFSPVKSTYTWSDYQTNRGDKIDSLTYKAYGKYSLEVDAFDYNTTSADCKGCVAIVDGFRPVATTACPKRFCDKSTSDCNADEGIVELTTENLEKIEMQIKNYFDFQDKAINDACDANTANKRCDHECIESMSFVDKSYKNAGSYRSGGTLFYNKAHIKTDLKLVGKLDASELAVLDSPPGVNHDSCKRCVSLETELKEYWTDFKCGRNYDTEQCEGNDNEKCKLKQCMVVFGDTIAVATANINDKTKTESNNVVKELHQKGYNTETQVHVALECTKFVDNDKVTTWDPKCTYKAKVEDLIDIETTNNANSIFTEVEAKDFVTWRYRVDTELKWSAWTTQDVYTFRKAETKIAVEAWTKCGIVRKFFFYVNLHLNNDIDVCSNFRNMWYQSTQTALAAPDSFCMYPKSDFAEVTFDYHANIGLKYSPDRLNINIKQVQCRLKYDDAKGEGATIVNVNGDSREIVSRFAVLAQRAPTSPLTKFHVTCDFTYARYVNQGDLMQTCNQDFYITDCTPPVIDKPCPLDDSSCSPDTCVNSDLPAPFEACGGNIVSLDKTGSTVFTDAKKSKSNCCEFCDKYTTTCQTISALPADVNDIMRCEPEPKKETATVSYYNLAAAETLSNVADSKTGSATLLLSASAMVALVALVVVKRRRTTVVANQDAVDDVYYPLLN